VFHSFYMPAMIWRPMTRGDVPAVCAIAGVVHSDFPEDEAIFAERLALYPAGCHVLDDGAELQGYVVSHPWHRSGLPKLNTRLGALPESGDRLYLHDLALRATIRGTGAAARIVAQLAAHATALGFTRLVLVAVNRSTGFWRHQGFEAIDAPGLAKDLASYGADARLMQRRLTDLPSSLLE